MILPDNSAAAGRTIAGLGLVELGATVSAVRRRGQRLIAPASTMVLESGDVVVLLGSAAAVTAAEERLLKG